MRLRTALFGLAVLLMAATGARTDEWPAAQSPAIPAADGYVAIPGAAVPPDKATTYRALFDATQAAAKPTELLPAVNMAGSELNALAVAGVPLANARFGVANPNLAVLTQLKKAGVELYGLLSF